MTREAARNAWPDHPGARTARRPPAAAAPTRSGSQRVSERTGKCAGPARLARWTVARHRAGVEACESTSEAIAPWHFWAAQAHCC